MIYTTLNRIRAHSPCEHGWRKLLTYLRKTSADDEPLAYSTILDSNGLDDALWCLRAEPQHANLYRIYAVRCARRVQHLMTDPRSVATDEELAAARAAWAAWDAAWDAARAAARAAARDVQAADLRAMLAAYEAQPGCVGLPVMEVVT